MTDAITLLTSDHRRVEALWARLDHEASYDGSVVDEIVRELSIHDGIEKQLLYPTIREHVQGGDAIADRSLREHQMVEDLLARVEAESRPAAKLAAVRETMDHVAEHVAEEEAQVFPALRSAMSEADLEDLGSRLERAKSTAPTHPHPDSPNSGAGAKVGGAVAGLMDRAKDAFTGRPSDR